MTRPRTINGICIRDLQATKRLLYFPIVAAYFVFSAKSVFEPLNALVMAVISITGSTLFLIACTSSLSQSSIVSSFLTLRCDPSLRYPLISPRCCIF